MKGEIGCVPRIDPIGPGFARPLWSVMIPTFNCAGYLQQTLESVLEQDPGTAHMQIEVVDDCSRLDDPEEVVNRIGRGRVDFFRQRTNVGATQNFNACVSRSRGRVVQILHGDDYVLPGFYDRMAEGLQGEAAGAAFSSHWYVDESGRTLHETPKHRTDPGLLDDSLSLLAHGQRIQFAAMVVKRECYEKLGGFDTTLIHAADWEMWVRVAASYPIWFEPTVLAAYRVHVESDTSKLVLSGSNVRDIRRAERRIRRLLPAELRPGATSSSLLKYGLIAFKAAGTLRREGHLRGALSQAWQSVCCLSNPHVSSRIARRLIQRAFRTSGKPPRRVDAAATDMPEPKIEKSGATVRRAE